MATSFIIRKWVGLEGQGAPIEISINPFSTNFPLLYPLKTSENQRFSGGIEVEHWLKMVNMNKSHEIFNYFRGVMHRVKPK